MRAREEELLARAQAGRHALSELTPPLPLPLPLPLTLALTRTLTPTLTLALALTLTRCVRACTMPARPANIR